MWIPMNVIDWLLQSYVLELPLGNRAGSIPFHGTGHVFTVAISQRVVYIPWLPLGEPQLELTCNTSSSLSPCSPQSLPTPLETSPESQMINSNTMVFFCFLYTYAAPSTFLCPTGTEQYRAEPVRFWPVLTNSDRYHSESNWFRSVTLGIGRNRSESDWKFD